MVATLKAPPTKSKAKVKASSKANVQVNADFQHGIDRLTRVYEKLESGKIHGYYEIGTLVVGMMQDEKCGRPSLSKISDHFPIGRDALRPAWVIARRFEKPEFDRLANLTGPNGNRLSWSHIVPLSRLKDDAKLQDMAKKAVDSGWTPKELVEKVIKAQGGPSSKGGRKAKPAADPAEAVERLTKATVELGNKIDAILSETESARLEASMDEAVENGVVTKDYPNMIQASIETLNNVGYKLSIASGVLGRLRNAYTAAYTQRISSAESTQ